MPMLFSGSGPRPSTTPSGPLPLLYSFRFAHHGKYSSYHHLVDFLPAGCKPLVIPMGGWFLRGSPRLTRLWLRANEYRLRASCLLQTPSCVHYLYPENSLFRGLEWSHGPKLVVTWHQPLSYLEGLPPPLREHACSILEKANAVIFLSSDSLMEHINHLGIRNASVIKHGVDADFFHFRPVAATAKPVRVITVGSWLRDHRFWAETVGACLAMDSSIRFEVLCDAGNVARYAQHLPDRERKVRFVGALDDEQLRAFYHRADIGFLPLLGGTANNALLECMASGVPCVVSDLASTREYAGSTALFIRNLDPRSAAEALISLAKSPALRSQLASSARARVEQELAWPIIAKQHFELYSDI
jgi:glycosyltransferase involved in cell wall biosynthesis